MQGDAGLNLEDTKCTLHAECQNAVPDSDSGTMMGFPSHVRLKAQYHRPQRLPATGSAGCNLPQQELQQELQHCHLGVPLHNDMQVCDVYQYFDSRKRLVQVRHVFELLSVRVWTSRAENYVCS
jgi:hypothetical protein